MKKTILILITVLFISGTCAAQPYKFVHHEYTVQAGDTLDTIAENFCKKNTYGPRDIKEFRQGIIEINESLWTSTEVKEGQKIYINWFEKETL